MVIKRTIQAMQDFIKLESAAGITLFIFALLAIFFDNSPLRTWYVALQHVPLALEINGIGISNSLMHWVNDGLMAIFFFLVGLEIKREMIVGELNTLNKFALPGFAAVGGMLVPALIYFIVNLFHPIGLRGCAIPMATDIAFALGVLSLLGNRIPVSLKIFLTALAILDDLGAIIVIAIFYSHNLSFLFLILAAICLLFLVTLNLLKVTNLTVYSIVGIILWICVLKSGIHATLAGVALAMTIPLTDPKKSTRSPLKDVEKALHPWVAFLVLPIFAFFNAGLSFSGITVTTFANSIPLGIALGLFIGKQVGVFSSAWIAVKLKLARLPHGISWSWIYGIALICGIGFTMSLFIGNLAFNEPNSSYEVLVRLGVIVGSFTSGIIGYLVLFFKSRTFENP